jgi:AraC-like DNA-binding protein
MIYREVGLPSALVGAAFCAWQFLIEAGDPPLVQHSIPPDATTNLVLLRDPGGQLHAHQVGPALAARTVPVMQGWSYAGIRLRPEAAQAVTGSPPHIGSFDPVDLDGPLAGLWRDLADLMAGGTEWAASLPLLHSVQGTDRTIAASVELLVADSGLLAIGSLGSRLGLGERQFRRRFHAATGVAPKQYAAVQRLRRALILSLSDADWAGIACQAGFADQPHLARDIKDRFGAATARVAGNLGGIRHEFVAVPPDRFVQDDRARAA